MYSNVLTTMFERATYKWISESSILLNESVIKWVIIALLTELALSRERACGTTSLMLYIIQEPWLDTNKFMQKNR